MELEVKVKQKRLQGWMTAAGLYGVFGCLIPYISATPLGWVGALVGAILALIIAPKSLPRWLKQCRALWGLGAAALSLGECARGMVAYTYPHWSPWVPCLLLLAVGWRGSRLDQKARERCGKLLVWLMLAMTTVLVVLVLPRLELQFEQPRGREDIWDAAQVAALTFGCLGVITPLEGRRAGAITTLSGALAGGVSVSALGPGLAGMLTYPFLVLCDAAVFELRLSSLGTAMWALSESALLMVLLGRLCGGKWVKAVACGGVFLLSLTTPWPDSVTVGYLIVGALLGYTPYFVWKV